MAIGLAKESGLLTAIRYLERPVWGDASYRNKNENRAPVTFIGTSNHANHLHPSNQGDPAAVASESIVHVATVASFISANVKAKTQAEGFTKLKTEIEALAAALVDGLLNTPTPVTFAKT